MRYAKFVFFGLVILLFSVSAILGIIKWKEYKQMKLTSLYREGVEDSLGKADGKTYSVEDGYMVKDEGLVIFLEVVSKRKDEFTGTLHIRYIEDNFQSARIVKQNLKISGNKQRENEWAISIVDQDYKSFRTHATLKAKEFIFDKLPVLGEQSYILKVKNKSSYSAFVQTLSNELAAQTKIRSNNVFSTIEDKKLSKELKTILDAYPLNILDKNEKGRTTVHIHTSYLQELTKRINTYLTNIDRAQKNLQNYIQHTSPLIDYQFEYKVQTTLNNIVKEADKINRLIELYGDVTTFYENPSEEKLATFNIEDNTTKILMDGFLKTYNSKMLTKYSARLTKQENFSDALYKLASKKKG